MNGLQLSQDYRATTRTIILQEVLVFIWSTSEGQKTKSILDPPSGFELWTPELGIQRLNHYVIFRSKFSVILKTVTSERLMCVQFTSFVYGVSTLRYQFLNLNLLLFIQCCSIIHSVQFWNPHFHNEKITAFTYVNETSYERTVSCLCLY